jgi:membrane protease YdiL (CAAX protease family)
MKHDLDQRPARYSVVAFIILAMLLGTGTVYLAVEGNLPPGTALSSALSASVAGVIMTAVEDGRAGLKLMWRRLLIWRVGIGYWLFAFLFLVPTVLLGSVANPLFDGDPLSLRDIELGFDFVPMFILFFIVAGLGQELGWSGFLIPRLQARFSALTSCVLRAIIGALWHLPLFLYSMQGHQALADLQYANWIAGKGFLVAFGAAVLLFLLPWSVLISWVLNNTGGSLLLVAILHGSEIWVAYLMMSAGIDPGDLDNFWGYGAVLVVLAALIVVTNGAQDLSRKHERIVHW